MHKTIIRLGLAMASLAAVLGLAAVPASAASARQPAISVAVTNDSRVPNTTQSAYLRGWYWNYYDCDYAGFYGVYYGYWTGYFCNWSNSAQAWGLYA